MEIGILDGMEQENQFPICVLNQQQNAEGEDNGEHEHVSETEEADDFMDEHALTAQHWVSEYIAFWRNMDLYDFGLLMMSITINNGTWGIEAIVIFYYVLFMMNRYNEDIIYCTFMLFCVVLVFGVVNLIIPRLIQRIIPNYIWLMIIASFCMILVGLFGGLLTDRKYNIDIEYYWIFSICLGVLLGMVSMVSEMCILELQPTDHVGKVTGMKDCLKYIFRGGGIAIVGLFWHSPNYEAIWFGVALFSIISCTVCCIMWFMVKCGKKR